MDLIQPGEPGFVDRRALRRPECRLDATIRLRGRFAVAGRTADLTPRGARIDDAGPFPPQSQMWVRLPGLEGLPGRVVWSRAGVTGVVFDQPLHPAVYARFLPADSRLTLVENVAPPAPMPAEIAALPRREQIVRGYGAADDGPLRRTKKPQGGGLAAAIQRTYSRRVEHRLEPRHSDTLRTGPMRLQVDQRPAEIRNVSASGLRVSYAHAVSIGQKVAVEFEGFDALEGTIVWRRADEAGLALPRDALDLAEG